MRDKFPGFIPKSEEEKDYIWTRCFFVFDSNVLLNLYRYSDKSREEFFSLVESMGDRLWVPYRVAEEFLSNRLNVIYEQVEKYEDASSSIEEVLEKLKKESDHPFVDPKKLNSFSEASGKLVDSLNEQAKSFKVRYRKDEVLQRLVSIVSENVGDPKSNEDLTDLITKGNERFDNKIPPGYKDNKKSDSSGWHKDINRLGDYLIWEEVIEEADKRSRPVVLVTDDVKEDWWFIFKGERISSRPELSAEFKERVGQEFYMYSSERFISYARGYFDLSNTDDLVQESINIARNKERKYEGGGYSVYEDGSDSRGHEYISDKYLSRIKKKGDERWLKFQKEMEYGEKDLLAARVNQVQLEYEDLCYMAKDNYDLLSSFERGFVEDLLEEIGSLLGYVHMESEPSPDVLHLIKRSMNKVKSLLAPKLFGRDF